MHLSYLSMSLKIPLPYKLGCCLPSHSCTALFTFSLLQNWWPYKCCFSGPNKLYFDGVRPDYKGDGPEISSNDCRNSCLMCAAWLYYCAEGSHFVTRHPVVFVSVASISCLACHSSHLHWLLCPEVLNSVWLTPCASQNTNTKFQQTDTLWIFWLSENLVFSLHSILFCLRSEMARDCGVQQLVSFFIEPLKILKSNLKTLVFVLFCHMCWHPACTYFSVPGHHGQCHVQFTWTPPLQWINLELWLVGFSKIRSFLCAELTDVIIMMSVQPFSSTLHHFLTYCSLIAPLPYNWVTGPWILVGETCFSHNSQITLHSCVREQVSIVVAITHHLISWIASDCQTLAQSFACYCYYGCAPPPPLLSFKHAYWTPQIGGGRHTTKI
jgi:hypothetical protein